MGHRPFIVGMGGTTRALSTSETALRASLAAAERLGARTACFAADALDLPMYGAEEAGRNAKARMLVEALRACDGVLISSPAYHGAMSGLLKNALDYVEDLRTDDRPYFDGRAVGCIVCAYGSQAIGTTLASMRTVVHALRGWPTPLGVAINSAMVTFHASGACSAPEVGAQLDFLARQVVEFAAAFRRAPAPQAAAAQ